MNEELPVVEKPSRVADVQGRLERRLDDALKALGEAQPFAKSTYQTEVFQLAETLMGSDRGLRALAERAHRFDEVGVFAGGSWADPSKLKAPLVAGGLKAGGVYTIVESLSELRMLAIVQGRVDGSLGPEAAREFLNDVMALNLEYLFPGNTEEERQSAGPLYDSIVRLFGFLAEELDLSSLLGDVVQEIEQVTAQRPLGTDRIRGMIEMASRIPQRDASPEVIERLNVFDRAVRGSSPLSREHVERADYRQALFDCDSDTLANEARCFADSMSETGLTCAHHAILLRHLRSREPGLIGPALGLNDLGEAELAQNQEFALQLIRFCIMPATAHCIYGFARFLERGLLSRQAVAVGLRRLVDLDLRADVRRNLLGRRKRGDGVTANSLLVAGVIAVLGQPLGVGQGRNPTCQAARAISLWSQHAHGYLLEQLISAARDGFVEIVFEHEKLRSDQFEGGLVTEMDFELDPASIVLTPHLDVLYDTLMKRVPLRPEDGHKWVNPALYGRWVPNGFALVFSDKAQTTVADFDDFVRRFFATHHPEYNDGHPLMYPNPVGILVTNSHGDYLGPHAISLLRVEHDPEGTLRAYFYNPNNEGRQDWGGGVRPSVQGHGEVEGESSLPFEHFVSRLYAFHYNPYEEGDAYAVPSASIERIEKAARETWGQAFVWID